MSVWFDFSDEIDVVERHFNLPRLHPAFDGYRLVQISDFHIGEWGNERRLQRAVKLVVAQSPDMIALTGDFVSRDVPESGAALRHALEPLRQSAPDGRFAVMGNHDHVHGVDDLDQVLVESGVVVLRNASRTIQRNGASLHIAGVDSMKSDQANLPEVLSHLPSDGAAILMAHEPDFAAVSAPSGRFDLQISGHSHGGQICLPGFGAVFFPRHGRIYQRGLYHVHGMLQYTNRGIGQGHLPLRLNCRPEVSVLILHSGKGAPGFNRTTSSL